MKIYHAIIPSGAFLLIFFIYTLSNGSNMFSSWIYPKWFFELIGYVESYLMLMIPMFFGVVYIGNRRKAWSAIIIPAVLTIVIFAWMGSSLFYEMGWLAFYIMLFYLVWGLACVLTPRLAWSRYVMLRDKLGGRTLFYIFAGIIAAVFAVTACVVIFTITANIGKVESDYIPPLEQYTTTEPTDSYSGY